MNICYVNTVFGGMDGKVQDVVTRIRRHLMPPQKQPCPERQFTMIDRRASRHIVNIHQLQQLATAAGWNTTVVYLEDYNIRQQFNMIRCSKVLLGVQGQGMIWSWFLNKDASIVELYWDEWTPLYGLQASIQGIYTYLLKASVFDIDFNGYAKQINRTTPFSDQEKIQLRSSPAQRRFVNNPFKFASVIVSLKDFNYLLSMLEKGYNRQLLPQGFYIPQDAQKILHT